MDKNTICKIRDIYRAISVFEATFEAQFSLSINETMLLCALSEQGEMTSGDIAGALGVRPSVASKLIRMVEDKQLIDRVMGQQDRRQMRFSLSEEGLHQLEIIKCSEIDMPEMLQEVL
ncbi:MarR family winged helix-turn-helix transcriptional regulator [Hoylesella enoeca]|uniref:MarR family winged helix-turn-helix transcriptional regulator n=1 Tax=Hoylesella enoeca TaxID=76123 RepID=UPI00288BD75F|nr:MarR family winged helix-turn-helix transcriptional regulator [Hoylesella enoeca]